MNTYSQNVDALSRLVGICDKRSDSYKPTNAAIGRTALQSLLEESQKAIEAVHRAQVDLTKAITLRQRAYNKLPVMTTRIMAIAAACGLPKDRMEDLKILATRFRSKPFPRTSEKQKEQGTVGSASAPTRFNRQLGFETKLQNFDLVVKFATAEPAYSPVEPELTVEALNAFLGELRNLNAQVNVSRSALADLRMKRNQLVFGRNGINSTVKLVKQYMKGLFGFVSDEFKEVNSVQLKSR